MTVFGFSQTTTSSGNLCYNENMNWLTTINSIVVLIGIPTLVVALLTIGRKLQILDDLEDTMEKVKHNIKIISDFLTKKSTLHFNPDELKSYSPLSLTEEGKQLIKKLGFDNIFQQNKTEFFSVIESENPKLKYDVESAAIKSIYLATEKPYMDFLKIYFYNNPDRNLENTAPTLGVYVRDQYLAEHPEITQ